MEKINLLPAKSRIYGYILLAFCCVCLIIIAVTDDWLPDDLVRVTMPALVGGFFSKFGFVFETMGMMHEMILVLTIISLYMISFARETDEDEYCMMLRMKSWVWAVKTEVILTVIFTLFLFEVPYLYSLIINTYLVFVLFRVKFDYELWKSRKETDYEK